MRTFPLVLALGSMAALSMAQTAQRPQFEVASIKANAHSGFSPTTLQMAGNRFSATGMPLFPLIMQVYGVRDFQILGGPDWINTDQWDFEAVADKGTTLRLIDPEKLDRPTDGSLMVQLLIEDRFRFKYHRETKELPVYALTVGKNGPKIKPSTGAGPGTRRVGRGEIELQSMPFAVFVYSLARQLDHSLIDKTNLDGLYDLKFQWNTELKAGAEPAPLSDRPSLFTALQEQLGLKLETTKGAVEVLVIDSVSKPSEN